MLGLACYQLNRQRTALRHLRNALEMDETYAEALYLLGLVQLRLGERAEAARAFDASRRARGEEAGVGRPTRRRKSVRLEDFPPPALFPQTRGGRLRLLTGGDTRVAAALREDALASTKS